MPADVAEAVFYTEDAASPATVLKPASFASGQILVFILGQDAPSSLADLTTPSGWSDLGSNVNDTNTQARAWSHPFNAGDPASWDFGYHAGADVAGVLVRVTGADTTPVIVVTTQSVGPIGGSMTGTSVTPNGNDDLLLDVGIFQCNATALVETDPPGTTERGQAQVTGNFQAIALASTQLVSGSATGTRAWSSVTPANVSGGSFTIAIKSAAAGPPAPEGMKRARRWAPGRFPGRHRFPPRRQYAEVGLPVNQPIDATLNVAAAITAAASVTDKPVASTLTATATITATAASDKPVAASLAATATITAAAASTKPVDATLNATATLTASASVSDKPVVANLTITATRTVGVAADKPITATLSETATITAGATVSDKPISATLTITCTRTADMTVTSPGSVQIAAAPVFTATITAGAASTKPIDATRLITATITASPGLSMLDAATLAILATLTASAVTAGAFVPALIGLDGGTSAGGTDGAGGATGATDGRTGSSGHDSTLKAAGSGGGATTATGYL